MGMGFRSARLFGILAVCTAAASACSAEGVTTGAGGGSGDGGGSPSDPCAHLATAKCAKSAACASFGLVFSYGDVATCEAVQTARCQAALSLEDVTATPDDISACAAALEGESCDEYSRGSPPACVAATRGPRADGASCAHGMQCASGMCGDRDATGCGICFQELAEGAPCDPQFGAPTFCGAGLFCHDAGTCMKDVESGGSCDGGMSCAGKLQCISGTCAEPPGRGAPGRASPAR